LCAPPPRTADEVGFMRNVSWFGGFPTRLGMAFHPYLEEQPGRSPPCAHNMRTFVVNATRLARFVARNVLRVPLPRSALDDEEEGAGPLAGLSPAQSRPVERSAEQRAYPLPLDSDSDDDAERLP